jgi:hypothetical protein
MLRASYEGRIDYSSFDPLDPYDLTRESIILAETERRLCRDHLMLAYSHGLATAAYSNSVLDAEGKIFKAGHERLDSLREVIGSIEMPWRTWDNKKIKLDTAKRMAENWIKHYGDLDSPAVKQMIQDAHATLNEPSVKNEPEPI